VAGFAGDRFGMRRWYAVSLLLSQAIVFPLFMQNGQYVALVAGLLFFQQMFGQGVSGLLPKWVSSYFPVDTRAAGTGPRATPDRHADAILVTPNHQFPTGAQMPAARRFALLEAARRADALIVEDDYDSALRQTHPPLLALDAEGRVAMLGSFSTTLTPALALGYLIVPPLLRERVADLCLPTSGLVQDAVAAYMEADGLRRHTARVRREYRRRRTAFVEIFPEGVPMESGLRAVVPLRAVVDEDGIVARCRAQGLAVEGMSGYWSARGPRAPGIVLGLGTGPLDRLRERLAVLRRTVDGS